VTAPKRIQLRRTKGWRKPEGAVVVARPTRWGNPFRIEGDDRTWAKSAFHMALIVREQCGGEALPEFARAMADYPTDDEITAELRGRDLACWCPLDQACHADVLLDRANRVVPSVDTQETT